MYQTVVALLILFVALSGHLLSAESNADRARIVRNLDASPTTSIADTVFMEVMANETLIFALPDSLSGEKVVSWKAVKTPAYSRLADRSFMWKTRIADRGDHLLHFEGISNIQVDEFAVERMELWSANVRVR